MGRGFASLALFPLRSNRAFLQRARMGLPTPPRRARCNECTSLVSKVALCALRGGSRSVVCSSAVNVCFAFLTDFARGRGRGGRLPALAEGRFELCLGQHRAQSTAFSAGTAPRAAYARPLATASRLGLRPRATRRLRRGRISRLGFARGIPRVTGWRPALANATAGTRRFQTETHIWYNTRHHDQVQVV